jgi:hypothetical protein
VRRENAKNAQAIKLGTAQAIPLPNTEPSTDSDESLAVYLLDQAAKRNISAPTLAALNEQDLEKVNKALEDLTAKVTASLA